MASEQRTSLERLFNNKLQEFEAKFNTIVSDGVEVIPNDVNGLYKEFMKFKSEIFNMLSVLREQILTADVRIDELETYSRKNCLILHGLHEVNGEDVLLITIDFLNTSVLAVPDFKFNILHLDNCHRMPAAKNKAHNNSSRPVIIKFCNYHLRKMIWERKKLLKGTKFLLTELLTENRAALYKECREQFGEKNTWTLNGYIYVVLPNKNKMKICSISDYRKVHLQFKDMSTAGQVRGKDSMMMEDREEIVHERSELVTVFGNVDGCHELEDGDETASGRAFRRDTRRRTKKS